ncbi:hypothetical protein PS870_06313 [Pseudomonas fluorescens]|uniref:Uncharacterized protein n=1 Tax=Pseudomonas fluorescens TaxID=294 RepID=A0A5E7QIH2_PSEFL|nr:hypothetical protein [Pseudomonas fluorescens]VVP61315.1 hypothetical protein PS870_06313 [Pseudomonas fluorescens]
MSEKASAPIPVIPKCPPSKWNRGESAGRRVKVVMTRAMRSLGRILWETVKYLAGVLIKLVLGIAAIVTFVVVFIYATADSTSSDMVPRLNSLVAAANDYNVAYFQDQDWCEALLAEAGNYASSPASTCGDGDKAKPFDGHGNEIFTKIRDAAKKASITPIRISVRSEKGIVSFAQVDLSCFYCYASYIYSPQAAHQPDKAEKASVTDMSGGWYYVDTGI